MLSAGTVARKILKTRAEWKRLEEEIAAWRADPEATADAVAREKAEALEAKVARASKAEAVTRALAWALGIDLDLMDRAKVSPKSLPGAQGAMRFYSLDVIEFIETEGPVQIIPIDLSELGGGAENGGGDEDGGEGLTWFLLDVPYRVYADGTRSEMWSAILSSIQVAELRAALATAQLPVQLPEGAR